MHSTSRGGGDDGLQFEDRFEVAQIEGYNEKKLFFNKLTGQTGYEMQDILDDSAVQVELRLSTEENGNEEPILAEDIITEIHNIEVFDSNYKYNRRKMRHALVQELGLELAETGQRGGKAGRVKCIRFRGDRREQIRRWLIEENICEDHFPITVNDEGLACMDPKLAKGEHLKSAPRASVILTEEPRLREWMILQAGGDLAKKNKRLLAAVENGDYLEAQRAIESGAQPDCTNKLGLTPLMIIARWKNLDPKTKLEVWKPLSFDHLEIARLLLEEGAEPDYQTQDGYSALIHASAAEQVPLMRLLLTKGKANPDVTTNRGFSALHVASAQHKMKATELLLQFGADPNLADEDGWTSMMRAAFRNQTAVW